MVRRKQKFVNLRGNIKERYPSQVYMEKSLDAASVPRDYQTRTYYNKPVRILKIVIIIFKI